MAHMHAQGSVPPAPTRHQNGTFAGRPHCTKHHKKVFPEARHPGEDQFRVWITVAGGGTPCQMTRQRARTAEAERARSRLRQLKHVHRAGSEVWDAQARLPGPCGSHLRRAASHRLSTFHLTVGRHAVSDDTSASENGGGQGGSLTTQAAQARPQSRLRGLGRPRHFGQP